MNLKQKFFTEKLVMKNYIAKAQKNGDDYSLERDRREVVLHEIEVLKRRIRAIPFVDEMDLRFNHWQRIPQPTTQAVMFCIMDVSASIVIG